jgi:hypothetical protein
MFPPKLGCGTSAALRYNQNGFVGLQSSNVSTKIATTGQIVYSFTGFLYTTYGFFIYNLRVFYIQFTGFLYTFTGFLYTFTGFLYTLTGFLYTVTGFFKNTFKGFFIYILRVFLCTLYIFFYICIVMFPPKLGCGASAALRYNQNWLALLLTGNGSSRIGPQDLCRVMLPAELAGAGGE